MKKTLMTEYGEEVQHLPTATPNDYKAALKAIHTTTVDKATPTNANNRVLGRPAPPVDPSEKKLPRQVRTALAQLRSGFSRRLNSYMARISNEVLDKCPDCGGSPHDTNHLFDCPARPTNLVVTSLW